MDIAIKVNIHIHICLVHISSTLIGGICAISQGDIAGAVQCEVIIFQGCTGIAFKCLLPILRLSWILNGQGLTGGDLGAKTHSVPGSFYEGAFHYKLVIQPNLIINRFLGSIFCVLANVGQNLHIEIRRHTGDAVFVSNNSGSRNYCIGLCCFILIGEFYIQHTVNFQHTDHKCTVVNAGAVCVTPVSQVVILIQFAKVYIYIQIIFAGIVAYIIGLCGITQCIVVTESFITFAFKVRCGDAVIADQLIRKNSGFCCSFISFRRHRYGSHHTKHQSQCQE